MGTDRDRRPFPDGQRVYHQLRWDPRFDADACEIVLLDRHAGTKVIAFRDYLPNGPIPWHRIVGFRYRGEVLWDRASRIDRRTEALGQAPHGLVTAVSSAPVPRRPLEVQPASRPALPVEPVIVTWNVLSDRYEGDVLDHPTRWRALLDEVMAHTPDRVAFTEDGQSEELLGVDTQHPQVPTHFTWRGNGLLSLFTSEWDVVAVAPDASWAVLTFGATLATPAGADVISRSPTLDEATLQHAISVTSADEVAWARLKGLFRVSACQRAVSEPTTR